MTRSSNRRGEAALEEILDGLDRDSDELARLVEAARGPGSADEVAGLTAAVSRYRAPGPSRGSAHQSGHPTTRKSPSSS